MYMQDSFQVLQYLLATNFIDIVAGDFNYKVTFKSVTFKTSITFKSVTK